VPDRRSQCWSWPDPDLRFSIRYLTTRQFGPQVGKQALIIDARWNQGGHIPFHLLDVLRRQLYFYSVDLRRGVSQRNPSYLLDGPKCVLINGVTESGGDLLAYLVQKSAAAKLVGTRTMGAMAGAGGLHISFIDGGFSPVPTVGFYDLNGKWTVEGRGVQPDVEVADNPAAMSNGADPQLDAAIKLLMTELRNRPKAPQVGPPFRRDRTLRNNELVPPSSP
jgi:tricorn protease